MAAHAPPFEEKEEADVVVALEGFDHQREHAEDRVAAMLRSFQERAGLLIEARPRVVEDRLEQSGLASEIANELRLRAARFARDRRRRCLLVAVAREQHLPRVEETHARGLGTVGLIMD